MNKLHWEKSTPKEIGLHFAAVKYGEGAGMFEFVEWDGRQWLTHNDGTVIAFTTLQGLLNDIAIEWPEPDPDFIINRTRKKWGKDDPWEEI
jgi:hypothetical protein